MSQYLDINDVDYVPAGTKLTLPLIIQASALIDGYCNRKIEVTSYTERVPLTELQRGHLSYYPVVDISTLQGRPRHGLFPTSFFGPPQFENIDLALLDVDKSIGSLWCGISPFGSPYAELEVTYTSGWDPVPEKVKVACGQLVYQLASNTNPNVKAKKDFDLSIEYFGNDLLTPAIRNLLDEYRLQSFR